MDFDKEIEALRNKYLKFVEDRYNNNKLIISDDGQYYKDIDIIIPFMEELLGTRLISGYSIDANTLYFFPRFDDKIVKKYINVILNNGLKKAAEDWQNTEYHKNAVITYKQNIGSGESHNSILKIISIIRNQTLLPSGNIPVDHIDKSMEESMAKKEFLNEALFNDAFLNKIEEKGIDEAFNEYKNHKESLKNKSGIDISDDGLPF